MSDGWGLETPRGILRSTLARAVRAGAKQLDFGGGGAVATDRFNERIPLEVEGAPFAPDPGALWDCLNPKYQGGDGFSRARETDALDFDGLGSWTLSGDRDSFALKSRKAPAPCLEAVFDAEPGDLAKLRSLYLRDDVSVFLVCEGETRVRDAALALAAERESLGLPSALSVPGKPRTSTWPAVGGTVPDAHGGPGPFDRPSGGPEWRIEYERSPNFGARDPGRVVVSDDVRRVAWGNWSESVEKADGALVVAVVKIAESRPLAKLAFSPGALALVGDGAFPDAPWDKFLERKAAVAASRPSAPRTWHQTTTAVAESFVARKAPRGYVSNRSLYFHGPVAYSIWDDNPIAAIVENPGKKPFIFYGRNPGIGGSKAGTTSSARNDVSSAAGDAFIAFEFDDLRDVVNLDGVALDAFVRRARNEKDEATRPRGCSVDGPRMAAWFAKVAQARASEVERTSRTKMPTYAKAHALRGMGNHAKLGLALSETFGLEMPDVGSAGAFYRRAKAEEAAADLRQDVLRARAEERRLAERTEGMAREAHAEDEAPRPRF